MSEVLINVYRGKLVENIIRGDVAVCDNRGNLLYYVGDPNKITYFRSAAKPIQALVVFLSGAVEKFDLTKKEIAVMCASHHGERIHLETVQSILDKIGYDRSFLKCGIVDPLSRERMIEVYRNSEEMTELLCNCSGKHSGMLAACKAWGFDVEGYYKPDHILQKKILSVISEFCSYDEDKIYVGEDGCGVPVFGMPIFNMALGYARMSEPSSLKEEFREGIKEITNSMLSYPEMISGSKGFCTNLMKHTKGKIVAKAGADGVYCMGLMNKGIGIALKIESGLSQASYSAAVEILLQLGVLEEDEYKELADFHRFKVKNNLGHDVGYYEPVFKLVKVE